MKVVVALVRHETNTFSPIPTQLASFCRGTQTDGPAYGQNAKQLCENTNSAAAAYLDLAESLDAEVEFAILANSVPSGTVQKAAFEHIADTVVAAVQKGCDAVLLDLHGAMVAEGYPDAEGELLRRIRAVAPAPVPVVVALDFHANFSDALIRHATIITGYCTYPHVDIYETGKRAMRTLKRILFEKLDTTIVWRRLPMLTHMLKQTPAGQPMKDIMDKAMKAEAEGVVLNASVFGGFPLADIPHVGLSVVIVAEKSRKTEAEQLLDELCNMAWSRRDDFVYEVEPLSASITKAKQLEHGPVILVDHGDNCGAGGVTDVMAVLEEVMKQGLTDVIAGPIWDPQAVDILIQAGVGATLTIDLGGKTDMPELGLKGQPLQITGTVINITDGNFQITGPMFTGMWLSLGRTVVLESNGVTIFISEKPQEPYDVGVFTHAGIDPFSKKYVLIKSRQHFRAGFEKDARHIVLIAGPGVCSSDYGIFPFRHLSRPIYPLDRDASPSHAEGTL
ncbi:MlrC family protein 8 [Advenella kashmirensis W13003]|uniref:Microcystinase C n=1 Tax=Advenella kashmirensis W13003 TaxID=1424334 RepID=V8QW14_9BURK|nr:M81 family metallopeptidase [Advenella kashmirensis]ETF04121.1 MlrC family protein 8 [Advenella kashmirensis W13003]